MFYHLLFRKKFRMETNELINQEGEFTTIAQTLDTKIGTKYDTIKEKL